jgi:hypothetical protein
MGVQRPQKANPPFSEPKGADGSLPKSKTVNTLPISHFHSIACQKNPAKALIPIDKTGEQPPPPPASKHPRKPENPKKSFPSTHNQKIYFLANKRGI